jgi:hypothetical protein
MLITYTSRIRHAKTALLPYWEENAERIHQHYDRGLLTKGDYLDALAELHDDYSAGVRLLARRIHPLRAIPRAMALTLQRIIPAR